MSTKNSSEIKSVGSENLNSSENQSFQEKQDGTLKVQSEICNKARDLLCDITGLAKEVGKNAALPLVLAMASPSVYAEEKEIYQNNISELRAEKSKNFKTLENIGLDEKELAIEAKKLKSSGEIHKFIAQLLQKGVSPRKVEEFFPTIEIIEAPKPLNGVVPKGHENDEVELNSLDLPEKVTKENLGDFIQKIVIYRFDYTELGSNISKFLKNISEKPELQDKIINSINIYLNRLKQNNISVYNGQYGEKRTLEETKGNVNPYILERAITKIMYIHDTIKNDPKLEKIYGRSFLSDSYNLLVALGEDVDGAKTLVLENTEGNKEKTYTIIPIDEKIALAFSKIGIDMPIETVERYNLLYTSFVNDLSKMIYKAPIKTGILAKKISILEELPTGRKISLLKMYERGLENASFGKRKTKDMFCLSLIGLQKSIHNYDNYFNGGEKNSNLSPNLRKTAVFINQKFNAQVLTREQIGKTERLDDILNFEQEQKKLAKNEAKLAKNKVELPEDKIEKEDEKIKLAERAKFLKEVEELLAI